MIRVQPKKKQLQEDITIQQASQPTNQTTKQPIDESSTDLASRNVKVSGMLTYLANS